MSDFPSHSWELFNKKNCGKHMHYIKFILCLDLENNEKQILEQLSGIASIFFLQYQCL